MLGDNYPIFFKDYVPDELVKKAIKIDAYNHLKGAVKQYGLEHTEDIIKRVYSNPQTRDYMLKILHAIWKGI